MVLAPPWWWAEGEGPSVLLFGFFALWGGRCDRLVLCPVVLNAAYWCHGKAPASSDSLHQDSDKREESEL